MPARGMFAAALLLAAVSAVRADPPPRDGETVIPPGQEALLAQMLGQGQPLPGGCSFAGGDIAPTRILARYTCRDGEVVFELRHPSTAPASAVHTARFAIALQSGVSPPGLAERLQALVRAQEGAFQWKELPGRTILQTVLAVAVVVVPAAAALLGIVVLVRALLRRRGTLGAPVEAAQAQARRARYALAGLRAAGLAAVVCISLPVAAAHPDGGLLTLAGVIAVTGFLWLTVTGCFGYGSLRRRDWVGVLPFVVALVVREVFTLHSLQDIEVEFVQGPVGLHSVVYPLLQLFVMRVARDPQAFTMHLNGVLGAFASLAMYVFVRERCESRPVACLCAGFLAVHPVVARFAPTDGPYSLLLVTWFSGLALLSSRMLEPRALLGGVVLLGLAATTRIDGVLLLVASALLLDPRALVAGVRRDPVLAALAVLIVAALGVVQMYFLLPLHLQQLGEGFAARLIFETAVWPASYNDRLFTVLVLVGAASGLVMRRRLGLLAFLAAIIVILPVAHSTYSVIALHRLIPACALQAIAAGIGAHALVAWIPLARRWTWCRIVPGAMAACYLLVQHRGDLTAPYVFTEEYDLVRRHLAPHGVVRTDCGLMTFNENVACDVDIHDFRPVVPGMRVLDCRRVNCLAELSGGGCFYYLRSAASYFRADGVPPACARTGTTAAGDPVACMNEPSASFEGVTDREPVEVRTIDVRRTFPALGANYPEKVDVGLFRVGVKDPG